MKKALKNIAIIAILGIILLTLTGCANVNYDIKLNKDGSGDVSYVMGYDKSFLASMGVETTSVKNDDSLNDMKKEAEENGYTIEDYEDETTFGFKALKHVNNIQEEFDLDNITEDGEESNKIMYEKTVLKTKYSQDAKVDLTNMFEDNNAMLKAIVSQMKISYRITLPYKAGSNNATTVSEDGKTLEWTLKAGEVNEVKFEATKDYGMYALAGLALVLVIVAAVAVMLSKKAKKTAEVKPVEVNKEETKPVVEETQTEEKNEVVEEEKVEVTEVVPEEDATKEAVEAEKEETAQESTVAEDVVNEEEKTEENPVVEETEKQAEIVEVKFKETEEAVKEDENKEE